MEDTPHEADVEVQETAGTLRLHEADVRLELVEDRVAKMHGDEDEKGIDHEVDLSLKDLVNQTRTAWERGELSTDKAQDMLLV